MHPPTSLWRAIHEAGSASYFWESLLQLKPVSGYCRVPSRRAKEVYVKPLSKAQLSTPCLRLSWISYQFCNELYLQGASTDTLQQPHCTRGVLTRFSKFRPYNEPSSLR